MNNLSPHNIMATANEKLASMYDNARKLVRELSTVQGFKLPEPFMEVENQPCLDNFNLIGGGAECNAYLHEETSTVYKVPHSNNWKYWGEIDEMPRTMAETVLLQQIRYARVDVVRLAGLGAEYVPTWFISSEDPLGNAVFVIAQPYLNPEEYQPHVLSPALRAEFELAHVDDLSAANVLLNVNSKRLVLMDCLFATDVD